jgi:IS5 family transposase
MPALRLLADSIPLELIRPRIDLGVEQERERPASRERITPHILFKMLVLQQLFDPSDEDPWFHAEHKHLFEEFVDIAAMNSIPAATADAFFPENFRK